METESKVSDFGNSATPVVDSNASNFFLPQFLVDQGLKI